MTDQHAIETMLLEERRYPPSEEFAAQANAKPEIYAESFEDFWEREGRERLTWFEPFGELYEWSPPYAKWFLGGSLNVCFNCVDRHVEAGKGDKIAYHWEGEPDGERRDITYADLLRDVVRFANALKFFLVLHHADRLDFASRLSQPCASRKHSPECRT